VTAPVFVDASGRRARVFAAVCWALAIVFGGYVVLVAAALVTPPGTLSLTVPGLGPVLPKTAAPALTATHGGPAPTKVLAGLPTPSATPRSGTVAPIPSATAGPRLTPVPTRSGIPVTSSPRASAAASATPRATGRPTSVTTGQPSSKPTPTTTHGQGNGRPTTRPQGNPHASATPTP